MPELNVEPVASYLREGQWTLDPARSEAAVNVRNLGVKMVRGTVPVRAAQVIVGPIGQFLSVHAELDLAAIATAKAKRDKDLAKPALLDLRTHPTMVFDGTGAGDRVSGRLAVRGVEIPLELKVAVVDPSGDTVEARVTTGFDRGPLGMKVPKFMIGGWFDISVTAVFTRVSG